jgi:protein O-mannosyl-transferase
MSSQSAPNLRDVAARLVAKPWTLPALGSLAIALLSCVAYWPAMQGKFVWDDNWLILINRVIHAPDGLWKIWFTTDAKYYWPVTNSAFWLEWRLFGTETLGYHVVNLTVHIGCALLIWRLLNRLEIPGGFVVAVLWAIHPVSVEAVAWISQLKTVLSTFFLLLSLLAYLRADDLLEIGQRRWCGSGAARWYWLSVVLFLLGMLSKASIASAPWILPLILWWRHGQVTRWDLARLGPYVGIAMALVPVNMWFERHAWSGYEYRSAGFVERLLGAATVPWFYLGKALVPTNLMFIYPMWSIQVGSVRWWLPLIACIAVTAALVRWRDTWWGRSLLFAWAFFWIGLIPVLGFTDVSLMEFTLVSDHYQYVSIIAVLAVLVASWTLWLRSSRQQTRWLAWAVAVCVVGILTALTWRQSGTYRDANTLLEDNLARNPDCWIVNCGLGMELADAGEVDRALSHFQTAIELNAQYAPAHMQYGQALSRAGRLEEAAVQFEEAIRLNPMYFSAHTNLGSTLVELGRVDEAIRHFEDAIGIKATLPAAHADLGAALYRTGQLERAAEEFQAAVLLDPTQYQALADLGTTLVELGRSPEAIGYLRQAVALQPEVPAIHLNLGHALVNTQRPAEAVTQYEECIQREPDSIAAWANLAIAQSMLHRDGEAIRAAQRALSLARAEGTTATADQIEEWLRATYGAGKMGSGAAPETALPPMP